MLLLTTYRVKSHLTRADFKRLMDEFGKRGPGPGEVAHYVHIDGSGAGFFQRSATSEPVTSPFWRTPNTWSSMSLRC